MTYSVEVQHLAGEHRPRQLIANPDGVRTDGSCRCCDWGARVSVVAPTVAAWRCVRGAASKRHWLSRRSRGSAPTCPQAPEGRAHARAVVVPAPKPRAVSGHSDAVCHRHPGVQRGARRVPGSQPRCEVRSGMGDRPPAASPHTGGAQGPPWGVCRGGAGARVRCRCCTVFRIRVAQVLGAATPARAGEPERGCPRVRRGYAMAYGPQGQAAVQAGRPWIAFVGSQGWSRCATPQG
jgi:hypothetical protein